MIRLEERFSSSVVIDDILIPNTWDISIELIPNKNVAKNYNTALDRLQFYVDTVLDNSIIISPDVVQIWNKDMGFKGKVHMLPEEPYDHLMSICLYTKFNSILEKVFFVESVGVTSYQGQGITHTYDSESGDMSTLINIIDGDDNKEYIEYWYKPHIEYFDLDENGLTLKTITWDELGMDFDDPNKIVKLSNYKPTILPRDDDEDDNTQT